MKKLMIAAVAMTALTVLAEEAKEAVQEEKCPISIWGFGNYGIYSGYQLYGSLVNNEPTAQGYIDVNANIGDLGYVGLGLWSNTDLTHNRRDNCVGNLFNEYDPNVHFGRTFYFDDDHEWGVDWRSTVVWFYYPPKNYKGPRQSRYGNHNFTTWDFDHSFAFINPSGITPFITVVHEYKKGANLVDFGVKKEFKVNDQLTLTPIVEFVWRERQYNWCFPTAFNGVLPGDNNYNCNKNSGIATGKLELDLNYALSDHVGLFAKIAYCCVCDPDLRDNCDHIRDNGMGFQHYGDRKDFAWGGVGVSFNF